jgi:hypothetical protein
LCPGGACWRRAAWLQLWLEASEHSCGRSEAMQVTRSVQPGPRAGKPLDARGSSEARTQVSHIRAQLFCSIRLSHKHLSAVMPAREHHDGHVQAAMLPLPAATRCGFCRANCAQQAAQSHPRKGSVTRQTTSNGQQKAMPRAHIFLSLAAQSLLSSQESGII